MHSSEVYDMAIVGGGLAGLSLAIQGAMAGYKTVLFEKEAYPFHKVCGEYISNESYPFLLRLGIDLPSLLLPHIDRLLISDTRGRSYAFPLDLGGFGISRYKLDALLYERLLQLGGTIFTKTKVTDAEYRDDRFFIRSSAGETTARIACGAFGKRSNLDVQWKRSFAQQKPNKLNHYIGIKYHIRYPQPADTISLHNFANGYCGISHIEDDVCCLCYLTTAENLKQHGSSIAAMEQQLLSQNPLLKDIFQNGEFLYRHPLVISQISFDKKEQVKNGMLMPGDAAGLITPLCGNGMSMALHASQLAFRNGELFLQGKISRGEMERRYTAQWQQQFSRRLFAGRMVQRWFGNGTLTSLFLRSMKAVPVLANAVIKATHGKPF